MNRTSILVLGNHPFIDQLKGAVISPDGKIEREIVIERDSAGTVGKSCSINWKNRLYIFGGQLNKKHISILVGCKLVQVGTLGKSFIVERFPFKHLELYMQPD